MKLLPPTSREWIYTSWPMIYPTPNTPYFSVGDRIYALLRDYFTPNKPANQTYAVIEKALKEHYEPPKIVIAERFHFYQRSQAEDETVAGYVAALRKLASTCDFGDFLEDALHDCLVCGLRNESAQKKLLTEKDLTFVRAVEIAEGMQASEASTQQFSKSSTTAVHKVEYQPCHHCGKTNHTPDRCRFKNASCHNCNKKGIYVSLQTS